MGWFGPSGDCGCCTGGLCVGGECTDGSYKTGIKICNVALSASLSSGDVDNAQLVSDLDGLFVEMSANTGTSGNIQQITSLSLPNLPYELRIQDVGLSFINVDVLDAYLTFSLNNQPFEDDCTRTQNVTLYVGARVVGSGCATREMGLGIGSDAGLNLPNCTYKPDPTSTATTGTFVGGKVFGSCASLSVKGFLSTITFKVVRQASGTLTDPGC